MFGAAAQASDTDVRVREALRDVRVADVMRPIETMPAVTLATPAADALQTMAREGVNELPVVDEGRIAGIVDRDHLLKQVQARKERKAA